MIEFENTPELKTWLGSGSLNFFGLPYSGKDSQARRLAERLDGITLSSGDILRNSGSPEAKAVMAKGEITPTEHFIATVLPYLKKAEYAGHPLMLSSVGRWHGEEEGVLGALNESNHPLKAVIYLVLEENTAMQRVDLEENKTERGTRHDDGKDKLLTRISEFNNKTIPVIDYYRNAGLLIEIDASLSKDDVERKILEELISRASTSQ